MRIAILGSRGYPYVYSGYETFVSELSPRLAGLGHEVTVYCHANLFKSRPAVVNGIQLKYIPAIERKSLSQLSHSLLSTLHALGQDFDIVFFVNSANGPFGAILKLSRAKTAINVDGLEWLRPKWRGLGAKYFYWASHLATRLFDEIVTDSDQMAAIYREEFGRDSVTIAYGAYEQNSTQPELIQQFGLKPGNYYLVVARMVPDNNADLIVKGFAESKSEKKLVIVGDVPYRDAYAAKVKSTKDPRVVFPGYVYDPAVLRELYCNSFAYIHGHEHGGTNPTLLKALGSGCCILALDTVFSREVLLQGKHGVFFAKDPKALLKALTKVENDPGLVSGFRERARARIREAYTWEKITRQYDALFRTLRNSPPKLV